MSLLTVKNLSQTFIDKTLYEDANFVLNKEDHMGVTGQNGVGKSTLIKILTGEITQDECGHVALGGGWIDVSGCWRRCGSAQLGAFACHVREIHQHLSDGCGVAGIGGHLDGDSAESVWRCVA